MGHSNVAPILDLETTNSVTLCHKIQCHNSTYRHTVLTYHTWDWVILFLVFSRQSSVEECSMIS